MTTPLTAAPPAALAALAVLLAAAGCARQATVMLPPGLAENEARRATSAITLAGEAARTRNPDAAADKYRRAVREFREFPAAWNNLGVLMMQDDQYLQAAEAFSTAADLSPSDPRPLYNLGLLWDRRGYLREARRYYERAIARDANYLPALRGVIRADSLLNEGSTQTLSWLERALMLEQDDAWLTWMRLQKARIENLPSVRMQKQHF
jgi:Flp pilus assembly protein TadD